MAKSAAEREQEILADWHNKQIFQKTLAQPSPKGDFVFYDGPPFATGLPHYGHLVGSVMKDVVPRYWTMRGYHVDRRWGWDCHGLPIENLVEKELGFKSKKDIIDFGVDKFNEKCRARVLEFAEEWKKTITRLGRWADMENPYRTMDKEFMESVWWTFKQLWDKNLIYQDYKTMHVCPRCETTLSQQEVSEGYKDVKDLSVIAKFELIDEPGTFVLAWTTTPWTLPGNVALAVNKDIDYVVVTVDDESYDAPSGFGERKFPLGKYILAKSMAQKLEHFFVLASPREVHTGFVNSEISFKDVVDRLPVIKGDALVGKGYKPLFGYYNPTSLQNGERAYKIYAADFVSSEEGTGVVHIAPAFGEDDMNLGKKEDLPFIQHVKIDGHFKSEVTDFAGLSVKPIEDPQSTDVAIIKYLAGKGLLFSKEKFEHSYPHCWRCESPLINYATSSWFVKVTDVKDRALELAKDINWSPAHIKEGRFGKWLEGARDWSISRQRFWASCMPIWQDDKTNEYVVIGSVAELEQHSGQKVEDLHKHILDQVTWTNEKTGGTMRRIPDVLDTWFDSGSMPYAQMHYPFENEQKFEANFPAQFIAEGIDQTRAWFYYLHVLGTAIKDKPAFKNVIVNGTVLAEDGKKMSKRLNNYPDPNLMLDTYGADAVRYYLMTSPVVAAENFNFSEKGVKEVYQKNIMILDNVLAFYQLYATQPAPEQPDATHVLDRWIVARLQQLISTVTAAMDEYDLIRANRPIAEFINELSTWYVRRSRDRFRDGDSGAVATLGYVLREFSKIIAPVMPFIADDMYRVTGGAKESVHLETWPATGEKIDQALVDQMNTVFKIVEAGLATRMAAALKIRQPLASYSSPLAKDLPAELLELISDELNVKRVIVGEEALDTTLTDELKSEGSAREISRFLNQLRKDAGLTVADRIAIYQVGLDDVFASQGEVIKQASGATDIVAGEVEEMKEVEGGKIGIQKV